MAIVDLSGVINYGITVNFIEELLEGGGGDLDLGTVVVGYSEYTNDDKWEVRYTSVDATYGQNSDVGLVFYQDGTDPFLDLDAGTCGSVIGSDRDVACLTGPFIGDGVDEYSSRIYQDLPENGGDYFTLKDWKNNTSGIHSTSENYFSNADSENLMYLAIPDVGTNNYYTNEALKGFYVDYSDINSDTFEYNVSIDDDQYISFGAASISGDSLAEFTASTVGIFTGNTSFALTVQHEETLTSTITTTNGTESSSSEGGNNTASVSIGAGTTVSLLGSDLEVTAEVSDEFTNTWEDVESVNFSEESSTKRFNKASIDRVKSLDLRRITFYNLDYETFLSQLPNKDDVLIWLDPPYYLEKGSKLYGSKGDLHTNFDHMRLFNVIKTYPNWIMTYNNCEFIKNIYKDYLIIETDWKYGMNKTKESSEIVIITR